MLPWISTVSHINFVSKLELIKNNMFQSNAIDSCLLDVVGFTNGALKAWCGGEGRYNVNASIMCGEAFETVCDEPNTCVFRDGLPYNLHEFIFYASIQFIVFYIMFQD